MTEIAERNIQTEATDAVAQAKDLAIADEKGLVLAVTYMHGFNNFTDKVGEFLDENIKAAYDAHKALLAKKKMLCEPVEDAKGIVKDKIADFMLENPGASAKGLSFRVAKKPSYNGSITVLANLIAKGKLPEKLLTVDTKVLADLVEAGLDVPNVSVVSLPVVTIRK